MFPTPTAYSENKFIPFYNNVEDAIMIYEEEKNKVDYVLYSDEFYPCFDENCYFLRKNLHDSIKKNTLIFNISYGQNYYVYKR
jgi:NAD+--asparagine ADP-ribosyltransferase